MCTHIHNEYGYMNCCLFNKRIEDADRTRWSLVACVIACRFLATLGLCEAPAKTRFGPPKAAWGMASSSIVQGGATMMSIRAIAEI